MAAAIRFVTAVVENDEPYEQGEIRVPQGGVSYKYTAAGMATSEHLAKTQHRFEIYADEQDISLDLGYQFASVNSWADSSAAPTTTLP